MKKYIFTVFAVAAVLTSCSKSLEPNGDINSGAKAITTIGASTEISTRAVVSSSDNTKVLWQDGDQLGVLGANGSSEAKNLAYTLDGNAGSTTGTFKNETSDITAISAVMYPYQEKATWANGKLTCEIPSVQKATVGSFDKAAAIMYSTGNATNMQLKYAVNFLKVTVSESETNVHAISISSTTTALSGKMEITSSGVSGASSGSLNSVSITAARGEVLQTGDYYIAVKKGDIADPTISYVYLDQTNHTTTEKSKAGSGTLTFAEGTNVKSISVTDWDGATERKAFQLWAYGPYFAEYNVGVTDGNAESYGGYYNWGMSEVQTSSNYSDYKSGTDPLTGTDDTAIKLWGTNWRMPTRTELQGLIDNCDVAWTTVNDKTGRKFTGKGAYASNSVFLPAAGDCYYGGACSQGSYGLYWSSTPVDSYDAYYLDFFDSGGQYVYCHNRNCACSVRAVLAE